MKKIKKISPEHEAYLAEREARPKEFSDEAMHLFKMLRYIMQNKMHKPNRSSVSDLDVNKAVHFLFEKYHNDADIVANRKIAKEKEDEAYQVLQEARQAEDSTAGQGA